VVKSRDVPYTLRLVSLPGCGFLLRFEAFKSTSRMYGAVLPTFRAHDHRHHRQMQNAYWSQAGLAMLRTRRRQTGKIGMVGTTLRRMQARIFGVVPGTNQCIRFPSFGCGSYGFRLSAACGFKASFARTPLPRGNPERGGASFPVSFLLVSDCFEFSCTRQLRPAYIPQKVRGFQRLQHSYAATSDFSAPIQISRTHAMLQEF
jgi:hypothetical protein